MLSGVFCKLQRNSGIERLHTHHKASPEDAHFEPEREGYLQQLIEEDRRRARRRRLGWLAFAVLAVAAIVTALVLAYQWTQTHYYVGESDGRVAIYQGVQQTIGPIELSSVYQSTQIDVDDLSPYEQSQVAQTINADGLRDALDIVDRLAASAERTDS